MCYNALHYGNESHGLVFSDILCNFSHGYRDITSYRNVFQAMLRKKVPEMGLKWSVSCRLKEGNPCNRVFHSVLKQFVGVGFPFFLV